MSEARQNLPDDAHDAVVKCQRCEYQWTTQSEAAKPTCPNCQYKTDAEVVAYERLERAKWLYDGAETIDEMIERLDARREHIEALKEQGWELRENGMNGYLFLERPTTETT